MGGADLKQYQLFCDEQFCDACHPNDAGYSYMASKIYQRLFGHPLPQQSADKFIY